jgi:5-methylcytosine-specific restriction endonuclease McrA
MDGGISAHLTKLNDCAVHPTDPGKGGASHIGGISSVGRPRTRGNGQGSVFVVPGRTLPWVAAVVVGWTPSGIPVRRQRYAATEAGAKRLLGMMVSGVIPPRANARKIVPETERQAKNARTRHTRDISRRVRFLVLQRDKFTCTYCGRRAPDVELHVDHRIAYSNDGANDPANYATACVDCNLGKSNLRP